MFCFPLIAKKNPREDLAHLNFIDSSPLVEGEKAALVRAGSDSFLNEHNETAKQDLMEVMHSVHGSILVCA